MAFELPPLPFPKNALEPHMSEKTLEFHHGKHHKAYVDTANKLVHGTPFEKQSLEEVIRATTKDESKVTLFNNVAQIWNHNFFWHCLAPKGGGQPGGEVAQAIEKSFGGYDKFKTEFKEACVSQFGSGWGWLVREKDRLKIIKTPNAVNPLALGSVALLTCDVWEHAYYLDFQNRRPDFVESFLDHLVNWEHVAAQLKSRAQAA
ncbi:MAG TPA: superoxide dismutase [Stellaceae bacterium]|nr:superoxide dismutase [Stellaceae bacterium]